jgi:hypothetical protein
MEDPFSVARALDAADRQEGQQQPQQASPRGAGPMGEARSEFEYGHAATPGDAAAAADAGAAAVDVAAAAPAAGATKPRSNALARLFSRKNGPVKRPKDKAAPQPPSGHGALAHPAAAEAAAAAETAAGDDAAEGLQRLQQESDELMDKELAGQRQQLLQLQQRIFCPPAGAAAPQQHERDGPAASAPLPLPLPCDNASERGCDAPSSVCGDGGSVAAGPTSSAAAARGAGTESRNGTWNSSNASHTGSFKALISGRGMRSKQIELDAMRWVQVGRAGPEPGSRSHGGAAGCWEAVFACRRGRYHRACRCLPFRQAGDGHAAGALQRR